MEASPTLSIFAGPTGSGKSKLRAQIESAGETFDRHIDPGDIAEAIADAPVTASIRANTVARTLRRCCLKLGHDFSTETDLSEEEDLELLRRAKLQGFDLVLYFVALSDPSLNRARLASRAEQTGIPVPTARIYTSYWRIMEHLAEAALVVDRTFVYDNSEDGEDHRLMAQCEGETITLYADPPPDWVQTFFLKPLAGPERAA